MMKHKGSSYCCRWFTLFLLAMGIVLVSPDIHTDFADNYKQMKSKGATATTTTPMNTNALRTIKMLEAMGIIDANRYNVNDKNNNNNNENNNQNNNNNNNYLNNYNSNMLIANNNNNNRANSKNSNKMHISSASSNPMKMQSQQLEPLADSAATPVEEELEAPELVLEHMVSTPQSMTIMVEKPTMVKHTTTTTTSPVATTTAAAVIMEPTTTTLSAGHLTTTLATASKPSKPTTTTTTTITIATSATTTHSGSSSTIKFASPDNVANINVSGINAKSTMMYKQQQQQQQKHKEQQPQQQSEQHQPQHNWQLRPYESQQHHPLQQQQQYTEAQFVVANSRSERRPQKYIGNTLLGDSDADGVDDVDGGDSGSTQATASMVVEMPERRGDDELESVTATTQTQIAINGNNNSNNNKNNNNNINSNNNRIVDSITTPITATTTTTTIADTITITPTTIKTETPTTTQSNQFESVRILYDHKANDATDDDLKPTKETDVQMVVVAQNEEMEVDRQYKQKFSNSYSVVNSGNTHNYAAVAQLSAHQHQQRQQHQQQQQRSRWVRQAAAEEEPIDKCRQFNEGDAAKNEFYSPDYPNYYPKNINCTRVITAPLGQIIRLDFRNSFHIEAKEDCKFDVLEIRDGQYGFSNLLGKFCGTDFPPEITSRERYLWLHFHSDESIEYSGFTAVYEFVDRRKEAPTTDLNCTIEKRGYEGFANSSDVPEDIRETAIKNRVPLDCIWRIQVEDDWKILMKFIEFRLVKPNDCDANFLDIFPEQTVMPLRLKNFCGSAGEGMTIEANVIHIRFYAEPPAIASSFSILYTAYRDRGAACTDEEFDCEDATCISKELECNLRDNCKFRWDEEKCKKEEKEGSEHILIIMIVFGLILGGMITTFLVNCIRKIMHDQKIIREIALPHASDIYHIDSFIWDAPKTAIFVGLQNDYMSEQNWQLQQQQQHQQQLQQQYQLQQQHEAYMLQQSQTTQPHPHDDDSQQLDADNGNCNGQRQISCHSQSQSQSNGDSSTSGGSAGGSGSGSACGSALNSHYGNHRGIAGGAYTPRKQDGNDNLYMHGLNCDNANGSCSAYTYHPNVVNFNDDEFVIVTNRNGREYPLGGCGGGGAYPPEVVANSYGYDVTPVSTDSITSSKSSPTTATN